MLTKVIIYAYTQRIYSSRQIAKAVRENIPFMWLAGRQRPDFRTLNRFRSQRMRNVLETVFTGVLQFLADEKNTCLWSINLWMAPRTRLTRIVTLSCGAKRLISIRPNSKKRYRLCLRA
ncbi:transposase [Paenibacillus rhizoplanae]